jgi:hypothetical protein
MALTASHDLALGRYPSRTRQLAQAHLRPAKSCGLLAKLPVYRWKGAIMSASGGQVQRTDCTGCFIRVGLSTVFNANIIVSVHIHIYSVRLVVA